MTACNLQAVLFYKVPLSYISHLVISFKQFILNYLQASSSTFSILVSEIYLLPPGKTTLFVHLPYLKICNRKHSLLLLKYEIQKS